jgi:hypothetical protein
MNISRTLNPLASGKRLALAGLATAALATTAAWTAKKARRAEREHAPQGSFIEVDGVRIHYLDRGQGTPVLLLHGNAVSAEDFVTSGLIDRLAERYRVIAFDRPGFGHMSVLAIGCERRANRRQRWASLTGRLARVRPGAYVSSETRGR